DDVAPALGIQQSITDVTQFRQIGAELAARHKTVSSEPGKPNSWYEQDHGYGEPEIELARWCSVIHSRDDEYNLWPRLSEGGMQFFIAGQDCRKDTLKRAGIPHSQWLVTCRMMYMMDALFSAIRYSLRLLLKK